MHSYLGHEGLPPSELAAIGREEVRSYGGEVVEGRVVEVTRTDDDRFRLELVGGHTVIARRVLAATGLVDELPDIEGLADHWGRDVIHCPFCHGFEVRDQRIVQIITHRMGLHPAGLFRQLSTRLTLVLHDGVDADDPEVEAPASCRGARRRRSRPTHRDGRRRARRGGRAARRRPRRGRRGRGRRTVPRPRRTLRVARPPTRGAPDRARGLRRDGRDRSDRGAAPLRRGKRDRTEPAGAAGGGRRQLGRCDDQLEPRPRGHRSRRPTIGQRDRLGSPLRGRPDLERQPERLARRRDRRTQPRAGRSMSAPARAAMRSGWPNRAGT